MGCASSKQVVLVSDVGEAQKGVLQPAGKAQQQQQALPTCGGVEERLKAAVPPELPNCGGVAGGSPAAPTICTPWNEAERLKSLRELGVLDTIPEPRFDTVVSLMKGIFQVEVALVSLVDFEELTFHARAGEWACKGGRAGSFCDWIFVPQVPTMLIIEDALEDARFVKNKFVAGPPGIRFYAGAPLVATDSGHRYGTLCIIDYKPRRFTADQYAVLAHFAEVVTRELERDKVLKWQAEALHAATTQHMQMLRTLDCFTEGVMLCDSSHPGWPILYVNDAWVAATGVGRDAALGSIGFWDLFEGREGSSGSHASPSGSAEVRLTVVVDEARAATAAAQGRAFSARVAPRGGGGAAVLAFEFKPSGAAEHLRDDCPHIGIPNFVSMRLEGEELGTRAGAGAEQASAAESPTGPQYYFGTIQWQGWLGSGGTSLPSSIVSDTEGAEGQSSALASTPGVATPAHMAQLGSLETVSSAGGAIIQSGNSAVVSEGSALGRSEGLKRFLQQQQVPHFRKIRPKIMHEVKLGPLVGSGSNGRCYRGQWHGTNVAVKILECWAELPAGDGAEFRPEGELQTDAVLEGLISKSLSHPHIVTTYDYAVSAQEPGQGPAAGKVYQQVWILQSYCGRGTLFDVIDRGLLHDQEGRPNAAAILQTALEIASAMGYLHDRCVMHGDLTPMNVLISDSPKDARKWIAQVGDFGLARTTDPSGQEITTDAFGTVTHMPPELLLHGTLTPASDVFSFGVILWEMWAGRRAWRGLSPTQIMHSVSTGSRTLEPPQGAPQWYQDMIRRCLSRERSARPTFTELLPQLTAGAKRATVDGRRGSMEQREPSLDGGGDLGGVPAAAGEEAPAGPAPMVALDIKRRVSLEVTRMNLDSPLNGESPRPSLGPVLEHVAG